MINNTFGFSIEDYPETKYGYRMIPLDDIEKHIKFHSMVTDNPNYYGTEKYEALKHNIEVNGYDEETYPIWIYRDNVVDGWHRIMASKELGLRTIPAKILPYRTSLEDIRAKVDRTEVGRQMTKTELAIKAWKKWKDGSCKTMEQSALVIGVSTSSVKAVNYVAKHGDSDWINEIFKSHVVRYGDGLKETDNIFTIKAYLEKKKKGLTGGLSGLKSPKKMTDAEMSNIKETLTGLMAGKYYNDILNISSHIYSIGKEEEKSQTKIE